MTLPPGPTSWRAAGPYLPTNASKAGLLEETRQFLVIYDQLGDVESAAHELARHALPQRSHATRSTIVRIIKARLTRWNPPDWVLGELAGLASNHDTDALKAALLLHVARQDTLLYDVVLQVIAPRWAALTRDVSRADVQRFLDAAETTRPEVAGWSRETREKLAGNLLSILRDYGLLTGTGHKRIMEPLVPAGVVAHLTQLLLAEGFSTDELPQHPDWQLWLWEPERVAQTLAGLACTRELSYA